ncbi:DNA repair protein endonuclease SAE2/CtIP C-terminus-domain-containing protein [Xylaria intraflava]|nr:DNA repair protein endonuclease SAE2/CtIP C-terminus-domain-containing protein [Xylaria intraflava]
MENWFRDVGRTILSEAIEGACDRISDSFKTEYQVYNETQANLTAELKTLRHKASQVDRLREENSTLKSELEALKEANRESTIASDATSRREAKSALRTPLASKSANQLNSKRPGHVDVERLTVPELKAELLRFDQSYTKLRNTCFDLQDALFQSNRLLRERTTSCDHWIKHARQLNEQSLKRAQKIKKLESKLAETSYDPATNATASSDGGDTEVEVAAEPAMPIPINRQHETLDISIPSLTVDPQDQLRAPSPFETDPSTLASEASDLRRSEESESFLPPLPQSRKSTEEEIEIKSEPLSDTPVIVSERPVRKRKYVGPDNSHTETLARIKTEHSPEPRNGDFQVHFSPHDSIDFDIEGHRVQTPKKQTKYQRSHGAYDGDSEDVWNNDGNARIMYHTDIQENNTNDESCRAHVTDPTPANRARSQPNLDYASHLLQESGSTSYSRARTSMLLRGLASLAEDSYRSEKRSTSNFSKGKKRPRASVLAQLLEPQTQAQDSRTLQSRILAEDGQSSDRHSPMPKSRDLPTGKDGCKNVALAPNTGSSVSRNNPPTLPVNRNHDRKDAVIDTAKEKGEIGVSALRQTPKASLRLDDFKVNPHANEGYDYAYTDVVRKQNDRACLQGCIKENCCGRKFRGLAKACRAGTSPSEFVSQLESYLGENCHRLSTMSASEKESLWVEAKMKELANTSGKHRHRYPRMPTPPGFWRADFPTTQEGEEYNEEAAKLERQLVEERYREAMRPGGLWVFRDE